MKSTCFSIILGACRLGAFFFCGGMKLEAFEITIPEDRDMSIYTDKKYTGSFVPTMTSGDFNGDGSNDLVVPYTSDGRQGFYIFLGPSWIKSDTYSNRADFQIIVPTQFLSNRAPLLADLDGDHKQEIIFHNQSNTWPGDGVRDSVIIIRGRDTGPDNYIDLGVTDPHLILNLSGGGSWSPPAVGNVDGDSYSDLLIGWPSASPAGRTNAGECFVFLGRDPLPTGTVDIHSDLHTTTIYGKTSNTWFGTHLSIENVDQDSIDDLVVDGHVFYGKIPFPSSWDLATTSANIRIQGGDTYTPLGDMNGDQRAEFLVTSGLSGDTYALLDGKELSMGSDLLDITPGSEYYVPTVSIAFSYADIGGHPWGSFWGDFDGDHLTDLFLLGYPTSGPVVLGIFSSDLGSILPTAISTASISFQFPSPLFTSGIVKDINNDGKDDFVSNEKYSVSRSPGNSWGAVHTVFGFTPLTNPSVEIIPRDPHSLRVGLNLDVDGEVTEMMILGNISDSFQGQWIPYQESLTVTLTTSPGEKTVQSKFRNGYLRESDLAQDTWDVAVESGQVTVVTNRLEPNSGVMARFEFQIAEAVSVDAGVYDMNGARVRPLFQADAPAGVLVVEWDGTTDNGRRVVPGVYYLIAKMGGRMERHKIVVRG